MAIESRFSIPPNQFPLGSVFEQLPEVTVELEQVIPSQNAIIPYIWVRGQKVDNIEAVFSEPSGVRRVHLVDAIEEEYLLRVEWETGFEGLLALLSESNVSLLKALGTNAEWTFDIRGEDRSDISAFHRRCREAGIPVTVSKLQDLTGIDRTAEASLTEKQREALVLAYDYGYFEIPREVTCQNIGAELGISEQAVASRIRRGVRTILGQTLSEVSSPEKNPDKGV